MVVITYTFYFCESGRQEGVRIDYLFCDFGAEKKVSNEVKVDIGMNIFILIC